MAVVRRVDAQQRVSTLAGVPTAEVRYSKPDGPVATARLVHPGTALMTADGSPWIGDNTVPRRLGPDGMVRTLARRQRGGQAFAMTLDRGGDVAVAWGDTLESISSPVREFHHFERYSASTPQAAPVRPDTVAPAAWPATRTAASTSRKAATTRCATSTLSARSAPCSAHRDGPATAWTRCRVNGTSRVRWRWCPVG
jgi:hypothetical protein